MAADKRDKQGATPAASRHSCRRRLMDKALLCAAVFLAVATRSGASEYKICATADQESLCKFIESSRTEITCVRVTDSVDCLLKMQKREADLGTMYPEEAFLAAKFLGDSAVVLAEVRHPERYDRPYNFETVAVVRKTLFGGLSALKGLSYCHPGFSKAQYWSDRVLKDFERRVLDHFADDFKCSSASRSSAEDELYRLSKIFNKACRPGTWVASNWWDKNLKRNYHSLCEQCEHPNTCSYKVQNKGKHSDALRCLTLQGGNVTYTALEFVQEYFKLNADDDDDDLVPEHRHPDRYNFLCPDGSTRPLTSADTCSWVKQPWTSVIATKSTSAEVQKNLMNWLEDEKTAWTNFLRNILTKGNGVLKFRPRIVSVADFIKEGRSIPEESDSCRKPIRWCTIGATEKKKCDYLSTAALTHGVANRIECIPGSSKIECLRRVRDRDADVVYIDSELGHIARKLYNLTSTAYLETQRIGNYYGVLVFKGNAIKQFKDSRGKRACFPQYNGLGWLTYVEALKYNSVLPSRSCPHSKKVFDYVSRACAPGAKDAGLNPRVNATPDKLCQGCLNSNAGASCEASPKNPYYGEMGALRCLENGDGDFAFLDFHAAQKHLSSNQNMTDFRILCRDGSVETFNLTNPDKCSFVQVNGGEVIARKDLEPVEKTDLQLTLMDLNDLFGTTSRSYDPSLKMFESFDGERNLLFKDSAVSLVSVYETQNRFVNNYIELQNGLKNCLEENGSPGLVPSGLLLSLTLTALLSFARLG